jgi:cyclin B
VKEIKVIKRNTCIKNNENKITQTTNEGKDCSKELKKIKVCIIGNKPLSPRKNITLENSKRIELQNAKEYLDDIYLHLKSIEKNNLPIENYMTARQTDINEKMRIILVNWIIEVHFKFHLLSETLFMCINIIDRYLSRKDINRKYLQLLGVTSLFIACKYEEIYAPSSKDLIFMTDNAYKIEEMIQMESDILNIMQFDLCYPTSLRFLEIYRHYLELDEINFYRCSYLNEICLINYNLCSFNPSLIACVCLYLNLKSNILYFKGYNEEQLFNITGYQKSDIYNCLSKLVKAVAKIEEPGNRFVAVKKKYSLEKYKKVSNDSFMIKEEKP